MRAFQQPALQDHRALRGAFGCFPTGVAVATCRTAAGAPLGVTVNSFTSVSLDPPLLSFALGTATRCAEAFAGCDRFALQILNMGQIDLSKRFSRPATASWEGVDWLTNPAGDVILEGCAAVFLCRLERVTVAGDHIVLMGKVAEFAHIPDASPLLFARGRYAAIRDLDTETPSALSPDWVNTPWPLAWG